ncbi:MAG: THUMP domain-containing protein [Bacteroidales bacterium]|nr:THUMP domain-containing protein [Bacteroidales bacterium]
MDEKTFPLIAKTVSGLEPVLAEELTLLGVPDVMVLNRAVSFTGDKATMYRVNYLCRTALRILKPLFHFEIGDQDTLYEQMNAYPWETVMDVGQTFAIDAVISYTVFTNSQFVAQRTKDAIADRFRQIGGKRPSVDLDHPDLKINVHLFRDLCTVSVDSSGQSLHRRGYRKSAGPAPINEVLAAGLIRLSGWSPEFPLLDPMCGSGTILIEAAMLAKNIPAGYFRKDFGFMTWRDYDNALWEEVRKACDARITTMGIQIAGFDRASRAIMSATENLQLTGLKEEIRLDTVSFEDSAPPFEKGFIISNPPYDERLKLDDSVAFYKMIGNVMKRKYAGFTAWLISSDLEALKFVGLRPSRKITIFNGPLECRFMKFDLFEGKKGHNPGRGGTMP